MKYTRVLIFALIILVGHDAKSSEQPNRIFLGHSRAESTAIPLLQREIIRQSILMSYREDLGYQGRDLVLGGPEDTQATNKLETITSRSGDKKINLDLRDTTTGTIIWNTCFNPDNYVDLLEQAERITSEQLPKQSIPASLKCNSTNSTNFHSEDSGSITDLFKFVRDSHSANLTPETYEQLVRSYAHLGLRSSHVWSCAYKAYQARALVYAQRFVRSHPDEGNSYFLRAYALGLCGLHADAFADIKTGRALPNNQEPEWLAILEAMLEFNTDALIEVANSDSRLKHTAGLLAMATQDYTPFDSLVFNTYDRLQIKAPVDIHALSQLNEAGGVSSLHKTTIEGFDQMSIWITKELPGHPLLPDSIRSQYTESVKKTMDAKNFNFISSEGCGVSATAWPELDYVPQLQSVLTEETKSGRDQGEPSLGAYSHLLSENMFQTAIWRQHFMEDFWGVNIEKFTQDVFPFIREHPYHPLVKASCAAKHGTPSEVKKQLSELKMNSLPGGAHLFFSALFDQKAQYGTRTGEELKNQYLKELDHTHTDSQRALYVVEAVDKRNKAARLPFAEQIVKTSPRSPFGPRNTIFNAKDWEKRIKSLPAIDTLPPEVTQAIAFRCRMNKKYKKAVPYYEMAIKKAPDEIFLYERLALNYKRMGNDDKWLELMLHSLNLSDSGLDHARTRCDIAIAFMNKNDIKEARKYAEAAATCYSEWALTLAEECAYIDGDSERAKELLIARNNRYSQDKHPWVAYFHAQVYGVPETEPWFIKIKAATQKSLNRRNPTVEEKVYIGYYLWLNGSPKPASLHFADAYKETDNIYYTISEALAHLERDDAAAFFNALKKIDDNKTKGARNAHMRRLASAMGKYYQDTPPPEQLYKTMIKLKKGPLQVPDYYFFTGKYLALLNFEEEAIQLFYKGIIPEFSDRGAGLFCCIELMNRGLDPFARYKEGVPPYKQQN